MEISEVLINCAGSSLYLTLHHNVWIKGMMHSTARSSPIWWGIASLPNTPSTTEVMALHVVPHVVPEVPNTLCAMLEQDTGTKFYLSCKSELLPSSRVVEP
jgi:hypothetical protein